MSYTKHPIDGRTVGYDYQPDAPTPATEVGAEREYTLIMTSNEYGTEQFKYNTYAEAIAGRERIKAEAKQLGDDVEREFQIVQICDDDTTDNQQPVAERPVDDPLNEAGERWDDDYGNVLNVTIPVSLDEAETIQSVLDEEGEDHLAEHVKWCIQNAKQKAGYLQPARKEGEQ